MGFKIIKELEAEMDKEDIGPANKNFLVGKKDALKDVLGLIDERIKQLKEAQRLFKKNNKEENPIIEAKLSELEELKARING